MEVQVTTGGKIGTTGKSMETVVLCWRFFVRLSSVFENNLPAVTNTQPEIINSSTELDKREQFNEI